MLSDANGEPFESKLPRITQNTSDFTVHKASYTSSRNVIGKYVHY